jgi:hypothetical protein
MSQNTKSLSSCAPQTRRVRQQCVWSRYLFNNFINDIVECIDVDETHAPVIGGLNVQF